AKEVFCFALGVGAGRRAFPKGGNFCSVSSKISVFSMSLSLHSHSLRKYACFFWRNLSLSSCFFRQKKPSLFPKNDFLLSFRVWVVFPVPPFQFFRVFLLIFRIVDRQSPYVQGAGVHPKVLGSTIFFINFLRV